MAALSTRYRYQAIGEQRVLLCDIGHQVLSGVSGRVLQNCGYRSQAVRLDLRREPREDEFMLLDLFTRHGIPFIIILTKADKLKKTAQQKQHRVIATVFDLDESNLIRFSARTRLGKEAVLSAIEEMTGYDEQDTDQPTGE